MWLLPKNLSDKQCIHLANIMANFHWYFLLTLSFTMREENELTKNMFLPINLCQYFTPSIIMMWPFIREWQNHSRLDETFLTWMMPVYQHSSLWRCLNILLLELRKITVHFMLYIQNTCVGLNKTQCSKLFWVTLAVYPLYYTTGLFKGWKQNSFSYYQ